MELAVRLPLPVPSGVEATAAPVPPAGMDSSIDIPVVLCADPMIAP